MHNVLKFNFLILVFAMVPNLLAQQKRLEQATSNAITDAQMIIAFNKTNQLVKEIVDRVGIGSSKEAFISLAKCDEALKTFNDEYYRTGIYGHEKGILLQDHPNQKFNTDAYRNQIIVATWLAAVYPSHEKGQDVVRESAIETLYKFRDVYARSVLIAGEKLHKIYYDPKIILSNDDEVADKPILSLSIGIEGLKIIKSDLEDEISKFVDDGC